MPKRLLKKLSALGLASVLLFSLAACKGKEKEKESAETTAEVTAEQTTKEAESEATAAKTTEAEPSASVTEAAEEDVNAGSDLAPLSGRKVSEEARNRRVIAVMLDNHPDARMQAGWSQADMVFEMRVEGAYTRYMALFQSEDAPLVGPIRSARGYYITRMDEFDSVYVHFGGSTEADHMLTSSRYEDIDGMVVPSSVIWRYNATGKFAPHNAYSDLETLRGYAGNLGYDQEKAIRGYRFNETPEAPSGGETADKVFVRFLSNNTSTFDYQEAEGMYTFAKGGVKQLDENTDEAVMVQNIIIQETSYSKSSWGDPLLACEQIGSGKGIYVSQGKQIPIRWEKTSEDEMTMYYTEDGEELTLNPGLTWVEVTDTISEIEIS